MSFGVCALRSNLEQCSVADLRCRTHRNLSLIRVNGPEHPPGANASVKGCARELTLAGFALAKEQKDTNQRSDRDLHPPGYPQETHPSKAACVNRLRNHEGVLC